MSAALDTLLRLVEAERASDARPLLVVITGATASGKTSLAIEAAQALGCEIISADSRQIYREIPITTAAPTPEQLAAVPHHMVGMLPLDSYYSAAAFETDAIQLLTKLLERDGCAVMCGGSMLYVDAVVRGIDPLPTITQETRQRVWQLQRDHGAEGLLALLEITDPAYYHRVDRANLRRVMHALEVSIQAGVPYSSLITGEATERPFAVLKVALDVDRATLFARIGARVGTMVQQGMIDEARSVEHLRHLNSLNTVGFKELFAAFDGLMSMEQALEKIARNTRVYAKKQLTWLRRDPSVRWIEP